MASAVVSHDLGCVFDVDAVPELLLTLAGSEVRLGKPVQPITICEVETGD